MDNQENNNNFTTTNSDLTDVVYRSVYPVSSVSHKIYKINFNNVKTLEDVIKILKVLDLNIIVYDDDSNYDDLILSGLIKEEKRVVI